MTITFGELFHLYYTRHVQVRCRNSENAYYFWKVHKDKWDTRLLSSITRKEIQNWVDDLGVKSKSSATRAVNMMSAVFNWGIRRDYYQGINPCVGVERFSVTPRERFMSPSEMMKFQDALEAEPEYRDLFWLSLLTCARKTNVLEMRWDEVNLELGIWRFKSKNGEFITVPLVVAAQAILVRRRRQIEENVPWVFPGRKKGKPMQEVKRAWKRVLERAGLSDLRIHDLRRTGGSYMAIQGESSYIIGKMLGHKDQRSTAVYARLNLEPVRKAMEQVAQTMTNKQTPP